MVVSAPLIKGAANPGRHFIVHAHHDTETGGWWADSDDIPGLITEAPTYDELVDRVIAVMPELCAANNFVIAKGDSVRIQREGAMSAKSREELNAALSKLGEQIWTTMWSDDTFVDTIHELISAKLERDGVADEELELSEAATQGIFGDDTEAPNVVRPKHFVRSKDWAKNSLYNLAARWVVEEALARMRIEQALPWDEVTKADK